MSAWAAASRTRTSTAFGARRSAAFRSKPATRCSRTSRPSSNRRWTERTFPMILDALQQLSDGQQVTADAVSGNTIDLGNVTPKRQIAVGEPMVVVVAITAAGTNSGSAKLTVIQSAAAALSAPEILGELDIAAAGLAAGKVYTIGLGAGVPSL